MESFDLDNQPKNTDEGKKTAESKSFKLQRATSRRLALQLLYAIDTNNAWNNPLEFTDEIFELISEENESGLSHTVLRKSWSRSRKLAQGIAEKHQEIDSMISNAAKNWALTRINQVDRNILRLASFEMCFATPLVMPGIAINEAVEMAKEFGQQDSWRFVNGVLDQIHKTNQQMPFTVGNEEK